MIIKNLAFKYFVKALSQWLFELQIPMRKDMWTYQHAPHARNETKEYGIALRQFHL